METLWNLIPNLDFVSFGYSLILIRILKSIAIEFNWLHNKQILHLRRHIHHLVNEWIIISLSQ